MEDKINELKLKLEQFQARSAAKEEIRALVTLVLQILKTSKENFDKLTAENLQTIKDSIAYLETFHKEQVNMLDSEKKSMVGLLATQEATLKGLLADIKKIKATPGEDGLDGVNPNPEDVVPLVLEKLPKVEPIKRIEIIEKINTGEKNDLKIELKQIDGLDKLGKDIESRALSILDQRTQFLINKTVKHDTTLSGSGTDADPLSVIGGGGGGGTWGSIIGTLSNQTDLQNALNLKAPLDNPHFTGIIDVFNASDSTYFTGGSGNVAEQLTISTATDANPGDTHIFDAPSPSGSIIFSTTSLERLIINGSGATLPSLSGGGLRMVTADNNGTLGAQAIPSGGGSQTPWTSDIDGGGFKLNNVTGIDVSSTTGSATIVPTTIRISSQTNASDWNTSTSWGNLDFWNADVSSSGPAVRARIGAVSAFSTGGATSLTFNTNNGSGLIEVMRFGYDGNVGFGTIAPVARLDVTPTISILTNASLKGMNSGLVYDGVSTMTNYYGHYIAAPTGTGTITNKYALVTEAGAGNVGIGTTSPGSLLTVGSITANTSQVKLAVGGSIEIANNQWFRQQDANGNGVNIFGLNSSNNVVFNNAFSQQVMTFLTNGNVGIGTTGPTAKLHIAAGTASANGAPFKLTSGTVLGTTEAGAIEYDGTHLYYTATNGGTRFQLDQQGGGTVTAVSIATANGVSGSSSGGATPALTITLGAITPSSVAATGAVTGSNLSGTNTGDQTTISGNAGSATILQTGRTIAITGDLAYTSPSFNGSANVTAVGTLATVNSNVGSFGSATQVATFTVNGKGLTTAAANVTITPAVGSITGLGTGISTFLATPSSDNLASAITDETGTGKLVFATKPTFIGTIQTITAIGALAFDGSLGNMFTKTIGSPSTFTQSNFSTGQNFIITVTGAFTITWFTTIRWITVGAVAPTQGAVTVYGFTCTSANNFDGYLVSTQ